MAERKETGGLLFFDGSGCPNSFQSRHAAFFVGFVSGLI
jgi:hypothetical protein